MGKLIVPDEPSIIQAHGRLQLTVRDANGRVVREQADDNLVTANGMTSLANSFLYNLVQNQNASWGSPFNGAYQNLGNAYGAVGSSTTTPTSSDITLGAEVYRVIISEAAFSANTITMSFFFPTSQANFTIEEAGVFINDIPNGIETSLVQTTLTSGLTSGTPYTSLATTAWPVTGAGLPNLPSGSSFILGYGTTTQQTYVSTAAVSNGATSVAVTSQAASQTWPIGTPVAFLSGQLFDHVVFASGVPKNATETATLLMNLAFTLT